MNYRHAYHAGNFADVVKHLALVAVLQHLQKKDTPFAVIDTHAGRGLYDLAGSEAKRTGESGAGIAKLRKVKGEGALATYLEIAAGWGDDRYPGSPLITARLLRPQDRLVAIEKHPDEAELLKHALQPFPKVRAVLGDGYERLPALLPLPERRGIVLIDPPYEFETDFPDAARAVAATMKRFANAVVLIWFPIKSKADADAFSGEILAAGMSKALRIDIVLDTPLSRKDKEKNRLTSAGLVVINPPYEFDGEMERALKTLAGPMNVHASVTWLIGA